MRLFKRKKNRRCLVISLDGFPCSMITSLSHSGLMPFCGQLFARKQPLSMDSVIPAISCVAWTTYMTGRNPGKHNIFGFIDRSLSPFGLTIPNGNQIGAPTLWKQLNAAGIPILAMNIPVTFPPETVDGTIISGFLGVRIEKSVYPPGLANMLNARGYVIDADTSTALEAPDEFLETLIDVMNRRVDVFAELAQTRKWRFAHLHIMETDRLFHFLWNRVNPKNGAGPDSGIQRFMKTLDMRLEQLIKTVARDEDELILMSDHGFCRSESEYQVNTCLQENGFLKWSPGDKPGFHRLHPSSRAYSLIPGRIFLNLRGREPAGAVDPGDRDAVLADLIDLFSGLKDNNGQPYFQRFNRREELYDGPYLENSADLILLPRDGIEAKGRLAPEPLISPSRLSGTHTFHDAFVWSRHGKDNFTENGIVPGILDMYPTVLSFFARKDPGAEGRAIFEYQSH